MEKQCEINRREWENPDNWTGPKTIGIYFSKKDSRCFVYKRIKWLGPTFNLGRKSGFYWLFWGTLFLVAAAFMLGRWTA